MELSRLFQNVPPLSRLARDAQTVGITTFAGNVPVSRYFFLFSPLLPLLPLFIYLLPKTEGTSGTLAFNHWHY